MDSGSNYFFARSAIGLAIAAGVGLIITCNGMAQAPAITWRHWLLLAFSLACAVQVAVLVKLNGAETISVRRMWRDLTASAVTAALGVAALLAFLGDGLLAYAPEIAWFIAATGIGAIMVVLHVRRATVVPYEVDGLTYLPGWRSRELRLLATLPPGHRMVDGEVLEEEGGRIRVTATAHGFRFQQPAGDPAVGEAIVMLGRPFDDRIVIDRAGNRVRLAATDQEAAPAG